MIFIPPVFFTYLIVAVQVKRAQMVLKSSEFKTWDRGIEQYSKSTRITTFNRGLFSTLFI